MMDYSNMTVEELAARRRQLAHIVNKRIYNFEKKVPGARSVYTEIAEPYTKRQGREKVRFSEAKKPMAVSTRTGNRPATAKEIEARQRARELAELSILDQLLQDNYRNTVTKYKQTRRKAYKTFSEHYGIDLTPEELDLLWKADGFGWLKRTVGSETVVATARAIAEGKTTSAEIRKRLDEMKEREKRGENFGDKTISQVFDDLGMQFKPEYIQQRRNGTKKKKKGK